MDSSGQVLPIRSGSALAPGAAPPSCVQDAVATVTPEFQLSAFPAVEDGAEQPCQVASPGPLGPGSNGGPLDYGSYYIPSAEHYSRLPKEQSLESQDSSTLSSPRSESLAQPGACGPAGATHALFQFSIGKILDEEEGPGGQRNPCELYRGVAGPQPPKLDVEPRQIRRWVWGGGGVLKVLKVLGLKPFCPRRVVMSVNDKWHYCHNCEVLVGSRAMRDRHLRLLGYAIVQVGAPA